MEGSTSRTEAHCFTTTSLGIKQPFGNPGWSLNLTPSRYSRPNLLSCARHSHRPENWDYKYSLQIHSFNLSRLRERSSSSHASSGNVCSSCRITDWEVRFRPFSYVEWAGHASLKNCSGCWDDYSKVLNALYCMAERGTWSGGDWGLSNLRVYVSS